MEKSKSKKKRRGGKPPLSVTGALEMPSKILAWERDLLAIVIKSVVETEQRERDAESEVSS